MSVKTYRTVINREMDTRRVVKIGNWLIWSPFNERPRLILRLFGRKYVFSDQAVFDQPWNRTPRFRRLATGFQVHVGRIRFSTLADR